MLSHDHYAVLGVAPDATDEEIEEAYQHLSRRYHPDLNPGDPQAATAYERIQLAYQVLTDPDRRARYDSEGRPDAEPPAGRPRPSIRVESDEGDGGSYRELFRSLREHDRRSRPRPGDDIHASVTVPLETAELGRHTTVTVRRLVPCEECDELGRVPSGDTRPCPRCGGSGQELFSKGALSITVPCTECGGDGLQEGEACPRCRAAGVAAVDETVAIHVPAGVVDGQAVRLPGLGHHGRRGGTPGDLVVTCRVEPRPPFERQGPNLHCRVPVSIGEAVLGGRIEVPTLDGKSTLKVPPCTQNGTTLRLRGRGLEMDDGRRGDLLVTVELWVPHLVDEDAKAHIREFDRRTQKPPRAAERRATVQP